MRDLDDIFGADGPLAQALGGYRPRQSQQRMASQVAATLADRGRLLVEAGTGTGKTFAYLIPALLSGGKVIVSTGTRTLQDQLYARDVPLLARVLGRIARIALLKGRSNYLCRERLLRPQAELALETGAVAALSARLRDWAEVTRSGDLAEVPELSDGHPLRARITSTRDSCAGARCAEFARCHVFAARRAAGEADLVVVNHHLLLADLALKEEGFGDLLPSADAVILDEAHQVPDLAAQFFGSNFGSRQVELLLQDLHAALVATGDGPRRLAVAEERVRRALHVVAEHVSLQSGPVGRQGWNESAVALDEACAGLAAELTALARQIADLQGGDGLQQCAARAGELCDSLERIAGAAPGEGARTLESTRGGGFALQLLPFDVGPRLRALVDARRCAWVFTSATLTVGGEFGHFLRRLGLDETTPSLRIDSPFDYARQALLHVPSGMPEPSMPGYADSVVQRAAPLVEASGGGAFLLFTSHRALERAAQLLRARWQAGGGGGGFPILVQGESPREQLLRRFRDSGDAVLLGTASFWEGVDVQGEALRLVVIDKLPFASPDDPLTRARVEHLRAQGGNPFGEYQLPEAALALQQGVGRLIRSETDEGVVVICDPRLVSRGYGRVLLASLPPMRRTRDTDEVLRFLRRLRPDGARREAGS